MCVILMMLSAEAHACGVLGIDELAVAVAADGGHVDAFDAVDDVVDSFLAGDVLNLAAAELIAFCQLLGWVLVKFGKHLTPD